MRAFTRIKLLISTETLHTVYQWLLTNIFSALLGCLFGCWFTKSKMVIIGLVLIFIFSTVTVIVQSQLTVAYDIEKSLKSDIRKGNWKEIIRTAYPISDSLWYSGKYKLRITLAEYTNIACINLLAQNVTNVKLNNIYTSIKYIRSSILLDDIGWTLFRFSGKYSEKAKVNILKGINIAESEKYYDLILKGYKHLFCIEIELKKNLGTAQVYLDKINNVLLEKDYQQLHIQQRDFIEAGLYYSLAASYLTISKHINTEKNIQCNYLCQANDYLDKAVEYYKKFDMDRYIKTFSVKAEILLLLDPVKHMPTIDELIDEGIVLSQLHQENDRYFRLVILKAQVLLVKVNNLYNISELELKKKHVETKNALKTSPTYYKEYKKIYKLIRGAKRNRFQQLS